MHILANFTKLPLLLKKVLQHFQYPETYFQLCTVPIVKRLPPSVPFATEMRHFASISVFLDLIWC